MPIELFPMRKPRKEVTNILIFHYLLRLRG